VEAHVATGRGCADTEAARPSEKVYGRQSRHNQTYRERATPGYKSQRGSLWRSPDVAIRARPDSSPIRS
jgi:hypothetical protein